MQTTHDLSEVQVTHKPSTPNRMGVLAGVGLSLLSSGLSWGLNQYMANQKYKKDMKVMEYQNWYNSPAQQMARYRAAGLNPHLAVSDPGQTATSTPTIERPDFQKAQLDDIYYRDQMVKSSIALNKSQALKNFEDAKNTNMDTELKLNEWQQLTEWKNKGMQDSLLADIALKTGDSKLKQQLWEFRDKSNPIELDKLDMQLKDLKYKYDNMLPLEKDKLEEQVYNLQMGFASESGDLVNSIARFIGHQLRSIGKQFNLKEIGNPLSFIAALIRDALGF